MEAALEKRIELILRAASVPIQQNFISQDEEEIGDAVDIAKRVLGDGIDDSDITIDGRSFMIVHYPCSYEFWMDYTGDERIGQEDRTRLESNPLYKQFAGKEVISLLITTSIEQRDIYEAAFLTNYMRRMTSDLRKRGHDSTLELTDTGNIDLRVYLTNDKDVATDLLEVLKEITFVPEFVDDGTIPLEVYESLSAKYHDIKPFGNGMARKTFTAEFAGQKRVIKIDRNVADPEHPNVERLAERGYNTLHELSIAMQISNPEAHHLTRLVDYISLEDFGMEGTITIEDFFDGVNLAELDRSSLNMSQYHQIVTQLVHALDFLNNTLEIFHRDIKPENILVKSYSVVSTPEIRDGNAIEVRVTDFALAGEKGKSIPKDYPSIGSHWTMNPMVFSCFNGGKESTYDSNSELYALGVVMYYALTGKYIFEFNADKKTGIGVKTGESVLDPNGTVNPGRYGLALQAALLDLEGTFGENYIVVISRLLGLTPEYRNLNDMRKDLDMIRSTKQDSIYWTAGKVAVPDDAK